MHPTISRVDLPAAAKVTMAAVVAIVVCGFGLRAQEAAPQQLRAYHKTIPWTGGTMADALSQSAGGSTIPMSAYSWIASKDGNIYSGVLAGGDPFLVGLPPVTMHAVVIPVIVSIPSATTTTTFDPTKANSCDGNVSAVTRFKQSPLVVAENLSFNKVAVGKRQFIDGYMRAEFWNLGGSATYANPISWSFASAITLDLPEGSLAIVNGSGCRRLAIVDHIQVDAQLQTELLLLQATGVVSPTKLAVFLFANVVGSSASPPSTSNCCIGGYHTAVWSPVQTYAVMDYDTTNSFGATHDIGFPTHELGEWMNDPLGNNPTPAWGGIGQTSGCQGNLEVGDPLSGTNMPSITMSGYTYHPQELAFFSWYFNSETDGSFGAGSKFSAHGTFKGPSKACPPGGTY
jgi:hypothetical protein